MDNDGPRLLVAEDLPDGVRPTETHSGTDDGVIGDSTPLGEDTTFPGPGMLVEQILKKFTKL